MKAGAARVLHAMFRPRAVTLLETGVIRRMPVARGSDECARLFGGLDPGIQDGNNLITAGYRQRAAGTKVILDIHNYQRIGGAKLSCGDRWLFAHDGIFPVFETICERTGDVQGYC